MLPKSPSILLNTCKREHSNWNPPLWTPRANQKNLRLLQKQVHMVTWVLELKGSKDIMHFGIPNIYFFFFFVFAKPYVPFFFFNLFWAVLSACCRRFSNLRFRYHLSFSSEQSVTCHTHLAELPQHAFDFQLATEKAKV